MVNRLGSVGGGGAGISGGCVLGASLELLPLFLLASSSLRPGLFFCDPFALRTPSLSA